MDRAHDWRICGVIAPKIVQSWLRGAVRETCNRRIFKVPTPRPDAFAFIEATCAQPLHVPVAPGPRHLALLRRLCDEADAVGDLVPDAVIGAIAVEYSRELITLDLDFARFAPSAGYAHPAAERPAG